MAAKKNIASVSDDDEAVAEKELRWEDMAGRENLIATEQAEPNWGAYIGEIYSMATLDFIPSLVEGISQDFRQSKEEIYQDLSERVRIALRSEVGNAPCWENSEERKTAINRIFNSLETDTSAENYKGGYPSLSEALRDAANEWKSRKDSAVPEAYNSQVRAAIEDLRQFLEQKHQGEAATLRDAHMVTNPVFELSSKILLDDSTINAFRGAGKGPSRPGDWPLHGTDGGGNLYLDAIARRLDSQGLLEENMKDVLGRGGMPTLIKIAYYGAQVIERVMTANLKNADEIVAIADLASNWDSEIKRYQSV